MSNFNNYKNNKTFKKRVDNLLLEETRDVDKEKNQKRREKEAKHNSKKRIWEED